MSDLVEFLRKRLDEDEQIAKAACEEIGWDAVRGSGVWIAHERGSVDDGNEVVVYDEGLPTTEQAAHIARHDPARVLREVEAKRHIIQWCVDCIGDFGLQRYGEFGALQTHDQPLAVTLGIETLLRLALPDAEHPDYREEWRP